MKDFEIIIEIKDFEIRGLRRFDGRVAKLPAYSS